MFRPSATSWRVLRREVAHRGFTLIELLVVVAIVALLISILLPGLAAARERARRVICATNLREQALAWHMYLDENRQRFPYQNSALPNANWNYGGMQGGQPVYRTRKPLNPYLHLPLVIAAGSETSRLFICPNDTGSIEATISPTAWEWAGSSYQMNVFVVGPTQLPLLSTDPCRPSIERINQRRQPGGPFAPTVPVSMSGISVPASELWLMGDGPFVPARSVDRIYERDNWHIAKKSYNVAFLDAHVEFMRIRRGLYFAPGGTVIPYNDMRGEFVDTQVEIP